MSKWWHVLASIGLAALSAAIPPIQGVIMAHPVVVSILGAAWAILGNLLQSPVKPTT